MYTAPYSPDLNPIEQAFNVYKQYLKRNEVAFATDPKSIHEDALNAISRDFCIGEFRRCNVPNSEYLLTSKEKRIKIASMFLMMMIMNAC